MKIYLDRITESKSTKQTPFQFSRSFIYLHNYATHILTYQKVAYFHYGGDSLNVLLNTEIFS